MIFTKAEFITSVASKDKFLKSDKPIIAVAGKSNVGKSSLINMLANQNKLAKTSVTPGRTRLINYFDFGAFILADLPGYGFAKVSKSEKEKWGNLMQDFFATTNVSHVFSLVDIRHDPTADDIQMINFLYHFAIPFSIIATKSDKLPKTKVKPQISYLATKLRVGVKDIIASSAEQKKGKEEIFSAIEQIIAVFNEQEEFNDQVEENEK